MLYYGVLASVTGGWLPFRIKNGWLIVFHLYLFISFIVFPLAVAFVSLPFVWLCVLSLVPRPLSAFLACKKNVREGLVHVSNVT